MGIDDEIKGGHSRVARDRCPIVAQIGKQIKKENKYESDDILYYSATYKQMNLMSHAELMWHEVDMIGVVRGCKKSISHAL